MQSIAYTTVLPLTARELHGSALYGATLAAGSLATVFVLTVGSGVTSRLGPGQTLFAATTLDLAGVALLPPGRDGHPVGGPADR